MQYLWQISQSVNAICLHFPLYYVLQKDELDKLRQKMQNEKIAALETLKDRLIKVGLIYTSQGGVTGHNWLNYK